MKKFNYSILNSQFILKILNTFESFFDSYDQKYQVDSFFAQDENGDSDQYIVLSGKINIPNQEILDLCGVYNIKLNEYFLLFSFSFGEKYFLIFTPSIIDLYYLFNNQWIETPFRFKLKMLLLTEEFFEYSYPIQSNPEYSQNLKFIQDFIENN